MACRLVMADPRLAGLGRYSVGADRQEGDDVTLRFDTNISSTKSAFGWIRFPGDGHPVICGTYAPHGNSDSKLLFAVVKEHTGLPILAKYCCKLRPLTEQEERKLALVALGSQQ